MLENYGQILYYTVIGFNIVISSVIIGFFAKKFINELNNTDITFNQTFIIGIVANLIATGLKMSMGHYFPFLLSFSILNGIYIDSIIIFIILYFFFKKYNPDNQFCLIASIKTTAANYLLITAFGFIIALLFELIILAYRLL